MTSSNAPSDQRRDGKAGNPQSREEATLDVLWNRVLEAWDEDPPHALLLEHAVRRSMLPEVAARYRALTSDPQKGAGAQQRLEAITVAAHSLLLSTRMPRPQKTPLAITLSAVSVCALLLAWLAWSLGLFGR